MSPKVREFRFAKYLSEDLAKLSMQPCQNVLGAGKLLAYSQLFAAYLTLEFTNAYIIINTLLALLPTTSVILLTTTKHFDRAEYAILN